MLLVSKAQSAGGGELGSQPGIAGAGPASGAGARTGIELRQAIERLIWIAVLGPVITERAEIVIERAILLRQKNNVIENFNVWGVGRRASTNRRGIANGAAAAKKEAHRTEPTKRCVFCEPGHRMAVPFARSREGGPVRRLWLRLKIRCGIRLRRCTTISLEAVTDARSSRPVFTASSHQAFCFTAVV